MHLSSLAGGKPHFNPLSNRGRRTRFEVLFRSTVGALGLGRPTLCTADLAVPWLGTPRGCTSAPGLAVPGPAAICLLHPILAAPLILIPRHPETGRQRPGREEQR